ncbi:EAL domain-containing protein [Primorskyibacter sp. S187A]|uniref:EAL domain-containing protein n=1 Tax=Primorskyibacter sp. S187A TaxID=3415130 RepID=UPI003C7BD6AE
MVEIDDLTSAYSRRYVRELFENEIQNGDNALLFIDLDNFKSVNDGYGHKSGDALLRSIANRLMAQARSNEVVFRIGGDEFGIYLRGVGIAAATERAAEIRELIGQISIFVDGVSVSRTASVGVARIEKGQDLVGALYYADEAQYAAKAEGGNAVRANTGATLRSMIMRRTGPRAEDLAAAIERNEVLYHVQPIFDSRSGRAIGVEALMRWQRADGRVFLPDQFMSALTGNYNARVTAPLEKAREISEIFSGSAHGLFCSFNITSSFLDRKVSQTDTWLEDLLNVVEPKSTVFEIVEQAVIKDTEHTRHVLNRLRSQGVRVALDDFGTGFSNLERLHELNVDIVKIDRRFVRGINHPDADLGILRALREMSETMGFSIIAEGVETQAELETLKVLGIYNTQGYHLGRPADPAFWARKLGLAPIAV